MPGHSVYQISFSKCKIKYKYETAHEFYTFAELETAVLSFPMSR